MFHYVLSNTWSDKRTCYKGDKAAAIEMLSESVEVIGAVTLTPYRAESPEWNHGRISQHWCPVCPREAAAPMPADIPAPRSASSHVNAEPKVLPLSMPRAIQPPAIAEYRDMTDENIQVVNSHVSGVTFVSMIGGGL